MNNTTERFVYKQYNGEDFDPVKAGNPFEYDHPGYELSAELMKWVGANATNGTEKFFSDIGADAAHIVEGINGVNDERNTGNIKGELLDYFICIHKTYGEDRKPCQTNTAVIYKKDGKKTIWSEHEIYEADEIIVCRVSEPGVGHGCKWFRVSLDQAKEIIASHGKINHR